MCGIYGVIGLRGTLRHTSELMDRMGAAIRHRGPDDQGVFAADGLLLGMRRLSIIDVSGGHQPITNEDDSLVVICNGEIYNFERLRTRLEQSGHRFKTRSDTEVLVHLYEDAGDRFLTELQGMFGLALWDRRRRRLIVARDPLGIKPLYYGVNGDELAFASEAKAILQVPGFAAKLDPVALSQFLAVGYVCAPNSMFQGIRKLPPGCALIVENGAVAVERYSRLSTAIDTSTSDADWIAQTRSEVERAVHEQMVSDVPIGAFLSGGIDSSGVVAFMSRHTDRAVKTYAIGFKGSSGAALYNELPYARTVAQAFRTDHKEILVQPDVAALLPELIWHLDEPVADAAFITTYLVSKFARQDVTVILSGVGGDELFGGYRRYLDEHYRRMYQRLPLWVRRSLIDPLARRLPSDRHHKLLNEMRLAKAFLLADSLEFEDRYRRYMEVFDKAARTALVRAPVAEFDDCIARAFADTDSVDPLRRLLDVDLATQMPEDLLMLTDKMSMAVSLECRVPLLDQRLVELAARMPGRLKVRGGELKHVLKRALHGILPDSILHRAKRGFGAPVGAWFKQELAPLVRDLLSTETIERRGLLNAGAVRATIEEHATQQADRSDNLLGLINLEIWCRLYLDGASVASVTDELQTSLRA